MAIWELALLFVGITSQFLIGTVLPEAPNTDNNKPIQGQVSIPHRYGITSISAIN